MPKGRSLMSGIEMAVEEINSGGGINGRRLKLIHGDDRNSVDVGREVAQRFVDDEDMIAVIGHVDSFISLPCSIMYEYHGLLMISPQSTAPKLTQQGFRRVFRTIPTDALFGAELARFAAKRKLQRVMIYHAQNAYGIGLANAFERQCEALGLVVPDRLAYDSWSDPRLFHRDLAYWKENFSFDGIMVAGSYPLAALFIKEARALGIDAAVLTGDTLDTPEFAVLAGPAAEGAFVGSAFLPDDPRPETRRFTARYAAVYGEPPAAAAALGYDTVMALVRGIRAAGSSVPDEIAQALRESAPWVGVTGSFKFDDRGDLAGREIAVKTVLNGKLLPVRE